MCKVCIRRSSIVLQVKKISRFVCAWVFCALLRFLACLLLSRIASVQSRSHMSQVLDA